MRNIGARFWRAASGVPLAFAALALFLAGGKEARAVAARASAIVVSPAGTRVWVVNPDADSVSVLDAATDTLLAEIPVGRLPRSLAIHPDGSRVYVACAVENSVDVLDAASFLFLRRIAVGKEPSGVAISPNGSRVWVANMSSDTLSVIDPLTDAVTATLPAGDHPRGIAVSADSSVVAVTRFLTVSPSLNGTVLLLDAPTLAQRAVVNLPTLGPLPGVPNVMQHAVFRPGTNLLWLPMVQSQTGNASLTFDTTVHPAIAIVDLATNAEPPGTRTDINIVVAAPAVSQPVAADFTPNGAVAVVANMASDDITILNAGPRTEIRTLLAGDAPQGVAITPDGTRAYVSNYLSRDVSVVSLTPPAAAAVIRTVHVANETLTPNVLNGKRLFFTSRGRMSTSNFVACISCHPDGTQDGRDWNFTQNGEGIRNSTDIHGIQDTGAVHWTANMNELQDLEGSIRRVNFGAGLVSGTPNDPFGAPNAGLSQDLDDFAAFMDSLKRPPKNNPNAAPGGGLAPAAARGKAIFEDPARRCLSCHIGAAGSDSNRQTLVVHDVGTLAPGDVNGQNGFDTPTMRGLWESAPYLHDATAPTLQAVIGQRNPANLHGVTTDLTAAQRNDLVAYMLAYGAERDDVVFRSTTGLPSGIRVPIFARDLSASALNANDPSAGNRPRGFLLRLTFDPAQVQDVRVERSGITTPLPVLTESDPLPDLAGGAKDYAVSFAADIPLRLNARPPGDLMALATFTLIPGAAGTIGVGFDPERSALTNDPSAGLGAKREAPIDETLRALAGSVTAATPEVADTVVGDPPVTLSRSAGILLFGWPDIPGATFNVYRGTLASLHGGVYDHTCYAPALPSPAATLPEDADSYYFLVTAKVAPFGEGSAGTDSRGAARPNALPCP